jgi:apolipoprotein D and lipocalin family protein
MRRLLLLPILCCACTRLPPPPTVDQLDIPRYMGTWYEIESLPQWFERGCRGVEAVYTLREDGRFDVTNRCWIGDEQERIKEAHALGWQPDPAFPGRLKVRFFWPFSAPYWVLRLDPDYRWALVGSPDRSSLWILSRTPTLAPAIVQDLKDWSQQQGYPVEQMRPMEPRRSPQS